MCLPKTKEDIKMSTFTANYNVTGSDRKELVTVLTVDDAGSLIMRWDNGSGLNVVFDGGDSVRKIECED